MKEREKFDKWYTEEGCCLCDFEDHWWVCWQAALSAAPTPPEVEQATNCAVCNEYKHTPLRVGRMGGYVCLTCIDKEINKRPPEVEPIGYISDFSLHGLRGMRGGDDIAVWKQKDEISPHAIYTSPPSPKAEWDAEGNPLNLEAAARDLIKALDKSLSGCEAVENLRKFTGES